MFAKLQDSCSYRSISSIFRVIKFQRFIQIQTARACNVPDNVQLCIVQYSLDNNVDHRKVQIESDIDSRGERCLQRGPICPSLHAGSLIVDRSDILIACYFPFYFLQEIKYLGVASSIIFNPSLSAVTRYYQFSFSRTIRRDLRNT